MPKKAKKRSLGRRLDQALFGIPADRRPLGFRNPAKKRRLYTLGLEAARRNPAGNPGAALVAAERTVIFREAAVADLPGAREFFLAGYSDGRAEQSNPKGQSAFDRCVKEVAAKGGAYDPRAVCAAAGRKKLGQAEMTRRATAGKKRAKKNTGANLSGKGAGRARAKLSPHQSKRNPKNPLDTAQSAYEGFHGEKSKRSVVIQEKRHFHTHVWALGPLVYLKVWLPADRRQPGMRNFVNLFFAGVGEYDITAAGNPSNLEFDRDVKNPVLVTANEKRNQMFFDGGDQSVKLDVFEVPTEPHEVVVLGDVSDAWYFTTKKHLGSEGGTAIYKHKLGEEGGELPTLLCHVIEKRLSLAGGSYTIPNEGVRN